MTVGSGGCTSPTTDSLLSKVDTASYATETTPFDHGLISIWVGAMHSYSFNNVKVAIGAYTNLTYNGNLVAYMPTSILKWGSTYISGYKGDYSAIDKTKVCTLSIGMNALHVNDKILITATSWICTSEYVETPLIIKATITNVTATQTQFMIDTILNPSGSFFDSVDSSNSYVSFKCLSATPL